MQLGKTAFHVESTVTGAEPVSALDGPITGASVLIEANWERTGTGEAALTGVTISGTGAKGRTYAWFREKPTMASDQPLSDAPAWVREFVTAHTPPKLVPRNGRAARKAKADAAPAAAPSEDQEKEPQQ